jgi:hypothetical protein
MDKPDIFAAARMLSDDLQGFGYTLAIDIEPTPGLVIYYQAGREAPMIDVKKYHYPVELRPIGKEAEHAHDPFPDPDPAHPQAAAPVAR